MTKTKDQDTRGFYELRDVGERIAENNEAFAILDGYPVSPGHALIIARRVIPTWFDATPLEQVFIMQLVTDVKKLLEQNKVPGLHLERKPDGYDIGINCGEHAGQTIMHLHVHLIPRYAGDTPAPRGGIRHVIPGKGSYEPR